jgi:hypothetical protein
MAKPPQPLFLLSPRDLQVLREIQSRVLRVNEPHLTSRWADHIMHWYRGPEGAQLNPEILIFDYGAEQRELPIRVSIVGPDDGRERLSQMRKILAELQDNERRLSVLQSAASEALKTARQLNNQMSELDDRLVLALAKSRNVIGTR